MHIDLDYKIEGVSKTQPCWVVSFSPFQVNSFCLHLTLDCPTHSLVCFATIEQARLKSLQRFGVLMVRNPRDTPFPHQGFVKFSEHMYGLIPFDCEQGVPDDLVSNVKQELAELLKTQTLHFTISTPTLHRRTGQWSGVQDLYRFLNSLAEDPQNPL